MEGQKVFFSYSRVDGEKFAVRLATDLRKAGGTVWMDQLDIRPGKAWDLEIEQALVTSTCVLFIATEHSTTSTNVLNEVYYALEENKEVIPVIFGGCKIPFRLKRLQHLNFTEDYNTAFNRLLKALNLQEQKEPVQSQALVTDVKDEANSKLITKELQHDEEKAKEQLFWNSINKRNDLLLYEEYIKLYPNGNFKDEATRKIDKLKGEITQKNFSNVISEPASVPAKGKSPSTIKILGIGICVALALLIVYFMITRNKVENKFETGTVSTNAVSKENDSLLIQGDAGKNEGKQGNGGLDEQNRDGRNSATVSSTTNPHHPPDIRKSPVADTNYYRLQLKNSGHYLDAVYCGTNVLLSGVSDFDDGACQKWRFVPIGNGWNGLKLKNGGKYLRADKGTANVVLIPASDYDANDASQQWRFVSSSDGWSRLQLRSGAQYLDADHCQNKVALNSGSDFEDGACQLWRLVRP